MEVLNKAQAVALFQREAVLLGDIDAVPVFRAAALFGEGAVEHAILSSAGKHWNSYSAGGVTVDHLTILGFLAAVSFYNTRQLQTTHTKGADTTA